MGGGGREVAAARELQQQPGHRPRGALGRPTATPLLCREDAIARLRHHNRNTAEPTLEAMQHAEESEFERMQQRAREEEEGRCPSLRHIPRFFERKARDADKSNSLRSRVMRSATLRLVHRMGTEEALVDEDLEAILALLKEHARERSADNVSDDVIDFASFMRIGEQLVATRGDRFRQFFKPSVFMKFPRNQDNCIPSALFFTFVFRKVNIRSTRSMVSPYDALGRGYLKEKDMENFIFELIPALPQLNQLQEEFYPFYVFTAVRKFFFFLDPKRTGRIRIRDLLSSQIIIELFELRQEVPAQDPESNWFSMQSALKVYMAYLDMDADQNGMLSKSELSHYGSGMLTQVFIDRVFEEYQTYRDSETGEREMDYKTFLDFVLAMENKNSRQAIQYFWKLIDIHHEGWIDGFVINYFFRAVLRLLQTNIPQSNKKDVTFVDDVKDEIFDMAKAKTPGRITLQDLINCRQGGTVLSMLIDAAAFWRYDNRETLIAEPDPDDEDDLKG